jgi:hypothetical protein
MWGAAILVVAVALGLWRLDFGLDLGIAFTDERLVWGRYLAVFVPLNLQSFSRPPGPGALAYPTLVGYLAGGLTWLTHKLGLIENPRIDVFDAFLVARMMTGAFAVATVALVGVFARQIDSVRAGVFTAALMAVVPLHVLQAHYVSTDPILCFFMTLALVLSYQLARDGGIGLAFLAGASVGLAFASKYTGLLAGVPVAWAVLERSLNGPRPGVRTFASLALVALAACLLGAVAGCPLCFLRYPDMLQTLGYYSGLTSYANLRFWSTELVPSLGWYGRPLLYQLAAALPFSLGIATYAASVAGIVWALRRRDLGDRLILVAVATYLFFGLLTISLLPRYLMPILAPMVLMAGRALAGVRPALLRAGLFALVWTSSALVTVTQINRLSYDQQMAVADWLKHAVARGEESRAEDTARPTVAVPQLMWSYVGLVRPFQLAGVQPILVERGRWLVGRPDYFVLSDLVADWIRSRPEGEGLRDDLAALESPASDYAPVKNWASTYFAQDLYTAIDPIFASDYPQGEIGFTIYARKEGR